MRVADNFFQNKGFNPNLITILTPKSGKTKIQCLYKKKLVQIHLALLSAIGKYINDISKHPLKYIVRNGLTGSYKNQIVGNLYLIT